MTAGLPINKKNIIRYFIGLVIVSILPAFFISEGKTSKLELLSLVTYKRSENIKLNTIEKRDIRIIRREMVDFNQDSTVIKKESCQVLDILKDVLFIMPEYNIEIKRLTYVYDTQEYDPELLKKRIDAIKQYFIGKGIEEDRLDCKIFKISDYTTLDKHAMEEDYTKRIEIFLK